MYGVVNQAIQELVESEFGKEAWEKAKAIADVEDDHFVTSLKYDDGVTFKLVGAVSQVLSVPPKDVLVRFGQWWILDTGKRKYGHMLSAAGYDFDSFLIHLPRLHTTIQVIFPDIEMPEFEVHNMQPGSAEVHYYSTRNGLGWFAYGIFQGLGEMFKVDVEIDYRDKESTGEEYDCFLMTWIKAE